MAKIRLTDKKLLNQFFAAVGFAGSIASIVALVITLPGWWKLLSIVIVGVLISLFVIIYCVAARKKSTSFRINGIEINVKEGDIFETNKDSINVIPFNEYFDVIVDNVIIAEHSLHGMYINKYWHKRENELNDLIHNDKRLSKYKTE